MADVPSESQESVQMPTKTAKTGQTYRVDGKTFTWTTDEGDDIRIPMRLKLGTLRAMSGKDLDDVAVMFELLEKVAPGQADVLDEQDVNDFTAMFFTWQEEYNLLNKVALGESAGSPNSSTSTAGRSNTTGEPVSASA